MRAYLTVIVCLFGLGWQGGLAETADPRPNVRQEEAAPLEARVAALTEEDITEILYDAFAQIGCSLPADLTRVFEFYLVDRVMTHIGEPVGPRWAQAGYYGARHPLQPMNHPQGETIRAAAQAIRGRLYQEILSEWLDLQNGIFLLANCEPVGSIFDLAPYDAE